MVVSDTSYLLRGACHVLGTPRLWKLIFCPLLLSIVVGLALLIGLMVTVFPAQAKAMVNAGLGSGGAWFLSFFITLTEVFIITIIVFFALFGQLEQRVFDKVYEAKASEEAREHMKAVSEPSCCAPCRGCGWFAGMKIALAIVTMPLNAIPILGSIFWGWINGLYYAWGLHQDYMIRHGVAGYKEELAVVRSVTFYSTFGPAAAMALFTPAVGTFFIFANAAGAALYAAEKEPVLKYLKKNGMWDPSQSTSPVELQEAPGQPGTSVNRA